MVGRSIGILPRVKRLGILTAAVCFLVPAARARAATRIGAYPALYPAFSANTTDYVSRCRKDRPLLLAVHAPDSARTAIGRRNPDKGSTSARLHLAAGQATKISIDTRAYHV